MDARSTRRAAQRRELDGPLYQNANRLAHLCFLESCGVSAWLVHLLFTGDPHSPTTVKQWREAVLKADAELGIADISIESAGHVLLPAGSRDELIA